MKTPSELYLPSPRAFAGLPELVYPFHDRDVIVGRSGSIGLHGRPVLISTVFAGQRLGLREVDTDVLARQLHALRSRIHRPGGTMPANHRHPVRLEGVIPNTGD